MVGKLASVLTLRFWSLACFGVSLIPIARYEYVAFVRPARTPHLIGSAPVPAPDFFMLLLVCAFGTALSAGVAGGLSIASYLALPRPRPGSRLTECVVINGVSAAALTFLLYVGIYAAIG